jgi:hypothetical protein
MRDHGEPLVGCERATAITHSMHEKKTAAGTFHSVKRRTLGVLKSADAHLKRSENQALKGASIAFASIQDLTL